MRKIEIWGNSLVFLNGLSEFPGFGNCFNLRKVCTMNFKKPYWYKHIFSICQFEQMYLFLACQNVTSMEMACGALEPLLPNLQISEGWKISLKISRPIQTQLHQYYPTSNFDDNFQYIYIQTIIGDGYKQQTLKYISLVVYNSSANILCLFS